MDDFKSGFVSLIGKTNVGKSTLLNAILGENIAITTPRPQTTRKAIKGIINNEHSQIIFTDTPGIHKPKNKFGEFMIQTAYEAISDVDIVLFLISAQDESVRKSRKPNFRKIKRKK